MKILIYGSGGVGGYFGGMLAASGANVTFLARGLHYEVIKLNGLKIISNDQILHLENVNVVQNLQSDEKFDLILVGLKAWQIKEAASILKNRITDSSVIIPLQNGILAAEELKSEINSTNILYGICKIFSKVETPGTIRHLGFDPIIIFGEKDNSKTERCLEIEKLFITAGFKAKIPIDIHAEIWTKFLYICTSGLCAVTRTNLGVLSKIPEMRLMISELLTEVFTLSIKLGIKMKPDIVERTLSFIDTLDPAATASLQRDIMEGRPSELDYQNGTVVSLGKQYNVQTPVNSFIYYSLLPQEICARKKFEI